MAKRKNRQDNFIQNKDNVIKAPLEEVMHNSIMPYAEFVIMERALPRVEDGLKPVQRRILYTMYELGTTPDKPYRKSARIVGDTMGKYHPHGDTSIYDAMVRMSQDFNMRSMLVDGHGNFGSIDGDSAAAMRYTEARLAPIAMELLRDIDKDTIEYSLNFDDTLKEPQVLPARFPNLLVNGSSGIAVGLATNIPPHNLGEVIDAVIARMSNPHMSLDELLEIIPGPDFPTGGLIIGKDEIRRAYETGKGRIIMRAKVDIEKLKGGKKAIVITELPYQVNKANMLEKILKLREEKKGVLNGIADIRDESDRNGIRAVIELKKDAEVEKILNYLYKYSDLQQTFGVNMVAIANGKPKQMGIMEILDHYIAHQKDVVTRRTQYELDRARQRAHIVEGLMIAIDNIDEIIRLIRISKNPKEARMRLVKELNFTETQAQAILDMRLQKLTNLEASQLKKEYGELQKTIKELMKILNSKSQLFSVIEKELMEIKEQYADDRRTKIIEDSSKAEISEEDLIIVEDVVVTLTNHQYIKSIPKKSYNRSNLDKDSIDLLDKDYIEYVFDISTDFRLLLFTDHGNCYGINCHDIPEGKWRDRGEHITSVIDNFQLGEIIVGAVAVRDFNEDSFVQFYTRRGLTKKTELLQFNSKNSKIQACKLREGDTVIGAELVQGNRDIVLITQKGKGIRFSGKEVNPTGRATIGVKAVNLKGDDGVVKGYEIQDSGYMLIVSDGGYIRKIPVEDYIRQGRGGIGFKTFHFTKNGSRGSKVIDAFYLTYDVDIVIQTVDGGEYRINSSDITKGGKYCVPDDVMVENVYIDNISNYREE